MSNYEWTTYWVILVDLVVIFGLLSLYRIGKASTQTRLVVGAVLFAALLFFQWGFGGGNFLPDDLSGLVFYAFILGGAGVGVLLFYLTSKSIFDNLSQEHIQLLQGFRVFIGGGFLMEGVLSVIPGWFSIMDGFLHISSGFLALAAAIAYVKNQSFKNNLLWLANAVGLIDIVVIVTSICFVVWPDLGPHHNMNYVVFGVGPILLWLHFMSIRKLVTPQVA